MTTAQGEKLKVGFGPPEDGWMSVYVQAGEQSWIEDGVSDVPADSLLMLAQACLSLINGSREAETTWFLEPAQAQWRWTKTQGRRLDFTIIAGGEERLRVSGSVQDLCFPVWRALRALQSQPGWAVPPEAASLAWSHPFPHKEAKQLSEALKTLKTLKT